MNDGNNLIGFKGLSNLVSKIEFDNIVHKHKHMFRLLFEWVKHW